MQPLEQQDKILEGARELFMQYGFKSVTMDDIAKHLSMSKKTLYVEFADKEALVLEVTKREMEKYLEAFRAEAQSSKSAIEELYRTSLMMRRNLEAMSPNLLYDMQKYHPLVWKVFKTYKEENFRSHLEEILERGVQEGVFRSSINPSILAILRMKEAEICFDHNIYPREQFDYRQVQVVVLDHFVQGLLTVKGRKQWNKFLEASALPS
jgi:AcrR family transcriptional regulator